MALLPWTPIWTIVCVMGRPDSNEELLHAIIVDAVFTAPLWATIAYLFVRLRINEVHERRWIALVTAVVVYIAALSAVGIPKIFFYHMRGA